MEERDCPVCDGTAVPLGHLGSATIFRCRACGITFSAASVEIVDDRT